MKVNIVLIFITTALGNGFEGSEVNFVTPDTAIKDGEAAQSLMNEQRAHPEPAGQPTQQQTPATGNDKL